jgi:predicted CXXCH cytochrome family protein
MARALEPLRAGELDDLASVPDADTGWSYRLEQKGRSARIVETWKGGETAISAELPFAIGAGLMDRSYAALVGDLLWFAPVEVAGRGKERHAALAPGHTIRPGTRFTTPIAEECLACHTDRLPPRDYPLNLRPDPASWQPSGVSCAACHGDVEGHARWRETDLAGGKPDADDPVLAASRAGWVESLSLCARCHLQGDASFLLEPGARGVPPPGGDVLAERAVFLAASPSDEIRFVSQVERLVRSRCFTESTKPSSSGSTREPLTCLSCHDPHRSSFDPKERAVVRNGCLRCHTSSRIPCARPPGERAGEDCVQCHMRRTGVFDVAGVEIHDHFIRRNRGPPSPAAELRATESKDGKLAVFTWPGRARPAYAEDPGLWMMALMASGRGDLALPHADRQPGKASERLATYHHLRGSLLEGASRLGEARTAYERALALDPAQTETVVNLGLLLGRLGKPREGIDVLDAAIADHPKAAGALRNRAVLKLQLGDRDGFAADLEAAFAISPDAALAGALAEHHRRSGRRDDADRWARSARALDPSRPSVDGGPR